MEFIGELNAPFTLNMLEKSQAGFTTQDALRFLRGYRGEIYCYVDLHATFSKEYGKLWDQKHNVWVEKYDHHTNSLSFDLCDIRKPIFINSIEEVRDRRRFIGPLALPEQQCHRIMSRYECEDDSDETPEEVEYIASMFSPEERLMRMIAPILLLIIDQKTTLDEKEIIKKIDRIFDDIKDGKLTEEEGRRQFAILTTQLQT